MDHKLIKQLVLASYTDGQLDLQTVEKITPFLNRKSLKQYIKALKTYEKQNCVCIESAYNLDETIFEDLFPNKKIVYKTDPSLILGIKVTNNDLVYDMNLKSKFNNLIDKIKQNYD